MSARGPRTLPVVFLGAAAIVAVLALPLEAAAAQDQLVPAQDETSLLGAARAQGGGDLEPRPVASEGMLAGPNARLHLAHFARQGGTPSAWNRPSIADTLPDSAATLANAGRRKRQGLSPCRLGRAVLWRLYLADCRRTQRRGRRRDRHCARRPTAAPKSNPLRLRPQCHPAVRPAFGSVRHARIALFFFD